MDVSRLGTFRDIREKNKDDVERNRKKNIKEREQTKRQK